MHLNLTIIIKSLCNIIEIPVAHTHTYISSVCLGTNLPFHSKHNYSKQNSIEQANYIVLIDLQL